MRNGLNKHSSSVDLTVFTPSIHVMSSSDCLDESSLGQSSVGDEGTHFNVTIQLAYNGSIRAIAVHKVGGKG